MRYFKLILVSFLFFGTMLFAQSKDVLIDLSYSSVNGGAVIVEQDTLLYSLISLQKEVNDQSEGVQGFRVQLYRGSGMDTREEAAKVKSLYLEKYPKDVVYQEFKAPSWIVRVGDFRTYGDALKLRNELENELSQIQDDIYIVPSTIKIY